eukprot:jgi/Astpho2/8170/Aster-x0800
MSNASPPAACADRQGATSTSDREQLPPAPGFADDRRQGADIPPQLQKSRQLQSEGLEGLLPRLAELAKLGGRFFLAFLPAVLIISGLFTGIYAIWGQNFIHYGSARRNAPPPYVDPWDLLNEPTMDPMIPLK